MVKTSKSGASGGLSGLKYKCKVCDVHLRGCDLTKHYERNTNWLLLSEMRSCVGKGAIEELKKEQMTTHSSCLKTSIITSF